jgi:hypothetical protein
VTVASKAERETTVTVDGIVVPLSELGDLVPGQRVRVNWMPTRKKRRNVRGVLAGKVRPITREEIKDVSREVWKDWIW